MLPPQEDLPRNRLINVFNTGKTSSGFENETTRHKSIKIVFLWFTHLIFPPAPAQAGWFLLLLCTRASRWNWRDWDLLYKHASNVSQVWWSLPWRVSAYAAKLYCWRRNKPVNQIAWPEQKSRNSLSNHWLVSSVVISGNSSWNDGSFISLPRTYFSWTKVLLNP